MRDGWATVPLGDLCTLTKGAYATEKTKPGPYPLVVTAGSFRTADSYQLEGEAVCIPTISSTGHGHASLKRVHYVRGKFAVANLLMAAQPRPEALIDARWLWLYLDHRRDELIVPLMQGTANVNLKPSQLVSIPIDLPPLAEQRRIVDLIAVVDEAARASSTYLATIATLIARVREVTLANTPNLVRLGSLLQSIDAGRSPEAEDRQPLPGEAAVLKVSAVRSGRFDPTQVKVLSGTDDFPPRARLRDGDVLMTRANTKELVGAVCRVPEAPPSYYLCDKTLRLNPRLDLVDPDYLVEVLLGDAARRQVELAATGTSASMKNISQQTIRDLRVPLVDAAGQRRLVGTVSALRRSAAAIEVEVADLASLRAALLADLLSGAHEIPPSYDRFLDGAA